MPSSLSSILDGTRNGKKMTDEGRLAIALRDALQLPPQVDLQTLAHELRLSILEVDCDSFDGALLRSNNQSSGRILVKGAIREAGRKRFTIAHEIGHFILHREQQISCSSSDIERWGSDREDPERQADNFASELLLPSPEVLNQIGNRWPSFQLVTSIADFFGTTLTATARKYCDIATQACALVWSVDGKIRWMHPSPRFIHWVGVGQDLSSGTFAAQVFEGKSAPGEMQEVAAEEWISSAHLLQDAVIWEQSIPMPFYRGCLSLLWAKREIVNLDYERDELLEELDPKEFTHERTNWPGKSKRRR
jgi:hypothetical protein